MSVCAYVRMYMGVHMHAMLNVCPEDNLQELVLFWSTMWTWDLNPGGQTWRQVLFIPL